MTDTTPTEPPQEPPVENPKRNWRGWLKEYAVIVIGVLTALAAQQAAEWWHWRGEVKAARRTLTGEIRTNDGYFARRLAIEPCIQRQIKETHAVLAALETGKPSPGFSVYRPGSGSLLVDGEWESQRASQTLTHFPRAELATMSRYYGMLPEFTYWMRGDMEAWAQLSLLKNPPGGLGTSEIARLRSLLGLVERYDFLMNLNSRRMLNFSAELGIEPEQLDRERVKIFCTGSDEEYSRNLQANLR